jgi:hypothetical protein
MRLRIASSRGAGRQLVAAGLATLFLSAAAGAEQSVGSGERRRVIREEITPALRLSVSRGLAYLVRAQQQTNSFVNDDYPVAANALVGLAFLAGGFTTSSGPEEYSTALKESTARLLSYQTARGYFDDQGKSRMYGHGFATLFLAELYGMSRQGDEQIRDALRRAINVIERSQNVEGGWDYHPSPEFGGDGVEYSDTSITVCQTMALRAARNLGIKIDEEVLARAQKYIREAQNADGGFSYRTRSGSGHPFYGVGESSLPRSAAGVCILYSLGDYSSADIRRGIAYLHKNYKEQNHFRYYAQYYSAQAMFQVGRRYWSEYFPWVRGYFLERQKADGSWDPGRFETSRIQCTGMALIVLQLPYRFLPIHER